jgi:hypothetical protein
LRAAAVLVSDNIRSAHRRPFLELPGVYAKTAVKKVYLSVPDERNFFQPSSRVSPKTRAVA